jgi:hypothetical protein
MTYRTLLDRGWAPIALAFLIPAAALGAFLPRLDVDAGTNVLLNEDDPDLAYYNITRAEWGYDEYAIVCARRADWFTPESQQLLTDFTAAIKSGVPHVKSVATIQTVPLLRQKPPILGLPNPAFLGRPGLDLEKARREILEHTQARGNLISGDGKDLSLLVVLDVPAEVLRLDPEWSRAQGLKDRARLAAIKKEYEAALAALKERRTAMVRALRRVAAEWSPRMDEPLRLSGLPVISVNLVEHVTADLKTFGAASFAFFVLAFWAVYRRARWTLLPIVTCLLPVALVVGGAAAAGQKITVITSNAPVLLFVLMLPYTVYFVERYRERRAEHPGESNLDTGADSASRIWAPCLYSCTTTMAGFASLLTSGISPVRSFGLVMALGMAVGLAGVFLFLPSASKPLRPLETAGAGPAAGPHGAVKLLERLVLKAPGFVVVLSALILGAAAWGAARLRVETKFIDYFRTGSEVYRGLEYIDTRMGGTTPLEIVLTSGEPGFFRTEEGLRAIAAAAAGLDAVPEAANVRSLRTLMDEGRKAIPGMKVEQMNALLKGFKMEGLIREFVNADFTVARVIVRFRETAPTLHRNNILRDLRKRLEERPELRGLQARPTGIFLLYANMLNSLIRSQKDTFLMVLGAIYVMLVLLFRAPLLSLVILVPQVLPVFACLGTMGWTGIPLDLVTVMIASVAMGVGIDAAIQYTVRYRLELAAAGGDRRAAVTRSHATIGRAIWIATSIVVAGFAILSFSKFVPTVTFGLFTALAMLMGQFAALTLLPSLFLLLGLPRHRAG